MSPDRRAARTAGALFIISSVAALLAVPVESPVLAGAGYLTKIAENASRVSAGGLLELIEAGTSAGIAIALYPVLRQRSEGLAVGSVAFRTLEAAMYAVGGVITLSLLFLVRQHATALTGGGIQEAGDALAGIRRSAILAGAFAYMTGALMYYYVFYRSRLVPRWLTAWGIAAEVPLLTACLLATFHGTLVTSYTLLALPIALQEYVLAGWLIFRGFAPGAARPGAVTGPAPA